MAYLGSWKIDDVLTFAVQTHTPATGADVDADSDPSYRIYENETATPIVTGTLAKLDDANTTGFYSEAVTLSAANGFEKGKCYNVRKTAIVGGVTGSEIDTLQIEAEVDSNVVSDKSGYALSAGGVTSVQSGLATTSHVQEVEDKVDTVDTVADAVKVQTDKLTFTKALELDVNLQSVNGVTVNGDGAGTPMGV